MRKEIASAYVSSQQVGLQILKALGVEPKGVRGFTIDVHIERHPTITIERQIKDAKDVTAMASEFERYELCERQV